MKRQKLLEIVNRIIPFVGKDIQRKILIRNEDDDLVFIACDGISQAEGRVENVGGDVNFKEILIDSLTFQKALAVSTVEDLIMRVSDNTLNVLSSSDERSNILSFAIYDSKQFNTIDFDEEEDSNSINFTLNEEFTKVFSNLGKFTNPNDNDNNFNCVRVELHDVREKESKEQMAIFKAFDGSAMAEYFVNSEIKGLELKPLEDNQNIKVGSKVFHIIGEQLKKLKIIDGDLSMKYVDGHILITNKDVTYIIRTNDKGFPTFDKMEMGISNEPQYFVSATTLQNSLKQANIFTDNIILKFEGDKLELTSETSKESLGSVYDVLKVDRANSENIDNVEPISQIGMYQLKYFKALDRKDVFGIAMFKLDESHFAVVIKPINYPEDGGDNNPSDLYESRFMFIPIAM